MKTTITLLAILTTTALAQTVPLEKLKSQAPINAFAFSPDGSLVAGGAGTSGGDFLGQKIPSSGEVILWDAKTGKTRRMLGKHDSAVTWVAWSGDGGLLASGSHDGVVKIWDTRSGATRVTLKAGGPFVKPFMRENAACAFSADTRALATVSAKLPKDAEGDTDRRTGDTLTLWELSTGRARWQVQDSNVIALAISADAKMVAACVEKQTWTESGGSSRSMGKSDAQFVAWETPTGKELWRVKAEGDAPETLAFLPDGRLLAVKDDGFTTIDAATGKLGAKTESKDSKRQLHGLTLSADGARFAATGFVGNGIFWGETATGAVSATQKIKLMNAAFSRDLKRAAGTVDFNPVLVTLAPAAIAAP